MDDGRWKQRRAFQGRSHSTSRIHRKEINESRLSSRLPYGLGASSASCLQSGLDSDYERSQATAIDNVNSPQSKAESNVEPGSKCLYLDRPASSEASQRSRSPEMKHFLLDTPKTGAVPKRADTSEILRSSLPNKSRSQNRISFSKTAEDVTLSTERSHSDLLGSDGYGRSYSPSCTYLSEDSGHLDPELFKNLRIKKRSSDLVRLNSDPSSDVSTSYQRDHNVSSHLNDIKRRAGLWLYPDDEACSFSYECMHSSENEQMRADIVDDDEQAGRHISAMELVGNGLRKLWCEIPEVIGTGLLERLTPLERQLQEAMFEVITSEASYLRSIDILVQHFYDNLEFVKLPGVEVRRDLFSNIGDIYEVSSMCMKDLESRWQQSLLIEDICDILYEYCTNRFNPYVQYCRFQRKQENTLKHLQETAEFSDVLKFLESDPVCQGLTLHSFILLPMQRVTRYPLLVEAILNRLPLESPRYLLCKRTLMALNRLVNDCNVAAQQYKDFEELVPKLRFTGLKIPMSRNSRWLLIRGETTRIKPEFQTPILLGSISKTPYWSRSQNHLFLLNDIMLVAKKKKNEDYYLVYDYCYRSLIQISKIGTDSDTEGESAFLYKPPESFKNCLVFTFIHNHCGKRIEYYFNFPSEKERINWLITVELWDADSAEDGVPVYSLLKSGPKLRPPAKIGRNGCQTVLDTGYESDGVVECTDEIFI